ncbi:hypothetical protein ARMSODRAFT_988813 [Armillaria solidipes]|uniref:Uncharacterized protein n=1 Tax=Armillaria solidipes TaxID=1076256 RepID=A0A2H3BPG9_9AGAR|nr:hypothetical protein ARMSODRAFT_988813 [Armillaria solidipes]
MLSLQRKYNTACTKLSDHKVFTCTVAMDDTSATGRVVAIALKNHCSVSEIEKQYDIQKLVLSFGVPKLAYALSKALCLPSIRSMQAHNHSPTIRACIGFPLAKGDTQKYERRPMSILIDEIALDERVRYDPDHDAVLGFSRVDAHNCDLVGLTESMLFAMADAVNEKTITKVSEATVAAIAPYNPKYYTPIPLLISGTCKRELDTDQAKWIKLLLHAWDSAEYGRATYGPIFSIASDGDAIHRQALHGICMSNLLSPDDDLFALVGHLLLMNLYCGKDQIMADFDYKHKLKNLASAIRSISRMLIMDFHVNPILIQSKLKEHLGYTDANLDVLFNNKDHMNVKNAVALLAALNGLSNKLNHENLEPDMIPLVLLGCLCGYLCHPYKSPSMSLSEQLKSLATAGHLLLVLFC